MENIKNIKNITADVAITPRTTFGELLTILGLEAGQKRTGRTPKRATLLAESGEAVVKMCGISVFRNGYALYENGFGRYSVLWLPYCTRFTYCFNKLRDAEKDYLRETAGLPEDGFAAWKWMPVIALFGEERITQKLNRGFGNADTKNNESSEDDEVEIEPEDIDWEGLNFVWDDETLGVDPLNAVIRRETRENMLAAMTDKQREVFILYHKYGWTQQQIAYIMKVSQQAVNKLLSKANLKVQKYF